MALVLTCTGAQGASTHDRYLSKMEFRGSANLGEYATGGIAVTAAAFTTALGAASEDYGATATGISAMIGRSADGLLTCIYDSAAGKIKAVVDATGAEAADELDLSAAAKTFHFSVCTLTK